MGSLVNHKLVHELQRQQVAAHARACLDEHVIDLTGSEIGEYLLHVEHACRTINANYMRTGIEQGLTPGVVRAVHNRLAGYAPHPRG